MKKAMLIFSLLLCASSLFSQQNRIEYKTGSDQPNFEVRNPTVPMTFDETTQKYVWYVNVNRSTGDLFIIRFAKDFSRMEIDYHFEILDTRYMYSGSGYRSGNTYTVHSSARNRFIVSFRIPMEDTINTRTFVMQGKMTTWIY